MVKGNKVVQGGRDASIGLLAAAFLSSLLCRAFPDIPHDAAFAVTSVMVTGVSSMFFNWWKHRETKRLGIVPELAGLFIAILFLGGCASLKTPQQPIDGLMVNVGEGEKFGTQAVFDQSGAPVIIGDKLQFEARPGFEMEFWKNGLNDETNTFWSDNLSKTALGALSTAVGFVDPWAGVAMLTTGSLFNNLTLPATADIIIPEYFVGNRVRIRVSGQAVAAGGSSQGNAVTSPEGDYVGTDLADKPYDWWVLFRTDLSDAELHVIEQLRNQYTIGEARE